MIALVTDSNSQVPVVLAERYDVTVIPLLVRIGKRDFREGVDLSSDDYYEMLDADPALEIETSQPSPGVFAKTYEALAAEGATEIISIHVGSGYSGTVNAARLGAEVAGIDVTVIDTGVASFGISCLVWEAAMAREAGATSADIAALVAEQAPTLRSAFVLDGADIAARSSGRLGPVDLETEGWPVLATDGPDLVTLGSASTMQDAVDMMATFLLETGDELRIAIGIAAPGTAPFSEGLAAAFDSHPSVIDLVRYRVGPSVAAHTGPGTAGGFAYKSRFGRSG